jgi:NAD(P)-dependent dehydrogenase (short-subunit alcohol dehydrogenase family)
VPILVPCLSTDPNTATGIGYQVCESFAKAGVARIVIIQRRESVLAAAKEALEKAYPDTKVEIYAASQSDLPRMSEVLKSVGEIDVLVACATSNSGAGFMPAKDVSAEDIHDMYIVNVVGLFHLIQQFLTLPSTAGSSGSKSVIHVSSVASQFYQPGGVGYGSSKAAANQIVTHFAFDNPQGNIKFFNIHPGAIYSPLVKENGLDDLAVWEDGTLQIAISELIPDDTGR